MPYVHPAWLEHQRKRWTRENAHLWVRPDAERWLRPEARQFQPPNWQRLDDPEVKAPRGVPETRAGDMGAETEALRWRSEIAAIRFELALIKAAQLRRKYRPDQPRVPAGNPDGGQWTSEDGGGGAVGNTNNTSGQETGSENPSGNDFDLGAVYAEAEAQGEPRVLSDATPDNLWIPGARYAADGHHYVPRGVFGKGKYSFSPETLQAFEDAKTGALKDPTSNWYDELHRNYNRAVEETLDRFLERNNIRGDQMTPDQARSFAEDIKTSRDPRIRRFNNRLWMREIMFWVRRGPRTGE